MSFGIRRDTEAENALANYIAYHQLSGGATPREETLERLANTLGLGSFSAKHIINDARQIADRSRGTKIEKAAHSGDVDSAFSMMNHLRERIEIEKYESHDVKTPCAKAKKKTDFLDLIITPVAYCLMFINALALFPLVFLIEGFDSSKTNRR